MLGNIGAHMKQPADVIVDIDPEEAGLLITLIETLFKEWYVARNDRTKLFATLNRAAEEKRQNMKS